MKFLGWCSKMLMAGIFLFAAILITPIAIVEYLIDKFNETFRN